MGIHEFLPHSELLTLVGQILCNDQAITVDICSNVLFIIAGYDSQQLNKVSVTPQCSVKTFRSSNIDGRPDDAYRNGRAWRSVRDVDYRTE
jgi:hypothetical protein